MTNIFDRMATETDGITQAPDSIEPQPNATDEASASDDGLRTSSQVKQVTQELLKHGYIEESQGTELFRLAVVCEHEIMSALEPLDLVLRLDSHRGIAYVAIAPTVSESPSIEDGWVHPLVRRQRLTLEQSLLVALLRQAFVMHEQEAGIGQSVATIAVDELLPHFLAYSGDSGSDAKNESRLLCLLDQLKAYGIVSEVDKKHEVTIRPLIAHLANPESLGALLKVLKECNHSTVAPKGEC